MTDIILGLIALVVGVLFCFGGHVLLRIIIPIWGAFAGFAFGAGLVSELADERFLGTVLGWVLGLVFALVFGLLAYLYYAVAVIISLGAIGFALASALMAALGIDWDAVIVIVAMAVALAVAVLAIVTDMPLIVLIVLSALGGSAVAVSGLMLMFGSIDTADFTGGHFVSMVRDDWWWYLVYLVLAVAGLFSQTRSANAMKVSARQQWAELGQR